MNATATRTAPTAAEVNDMARRLVSEDVRYCVSGLIYELARDSEGAWTKYEEEMIALSRRAPDADDFREAAEYGADFAVVVTEQESDAGGRWHWSATGADGEPEEGRASTELEAWQAGFDHVGEDYPDGSEIYEHWLVTDDLARRLRAQGESVVDDLAGLTVWGRATTGQVIYMDGVIQRIARDILEA